MARFVCEDCNIEGGIFDMPKCRRNHPNSVHKIQETDSEGKHHYFKFTGKTIKFKDIDSDNLNELVVFSATIMQTSDISNYYIQKTYKCTGCHETTSMVADDYRDIFDKDIITICKHCENAPMKLDKNLCLTGNIRKVMLQETVEEGSLNPRRIEAHLTSADVFDLQAGKDYKFEAKVWTVSYGKKDNFNRFVLDVKRVRCLDESTDDMPTPNEVEMFRQTDKKLVVESLAPQLLGRSNEKMAAIISFLSGGRVDGIRGDISMLLCGDPSTGKSDILEALHNLDKKSFAISGRSSSAAGMVMGVDNLPDGTRVATYGPVVLAHNHFVTIDEGDKMNPNDMSMLHDIMELQVAHLNKVGINITMPAQTKIIMAANPKSSRYDKDATIMANIGMPNSFLARFGYVFLVLDDFTYEMESQKLDRINYIKENGMEAFIEKEGLLKNDMLVKYLNHAKSITPEFSDGSLAKLKDLYLELKFRKQEKGSIDIDTRAYYDVIRASYSFARFRFSNKVEILDVNMAWKLYNESLKSFGMNTKGEFIETQLSSRHHDDEQWISECLEECATHGIINIDSLKVKLCGKPKICTMKNVDKIINELIGEGKLLRTTANGVFKYNG